MKYPTSISLRPGHRPRGDIAYADFYVDERRLAETLGVGDFIPPLGWLARDVEGRFTRMILREAESDLRPGRVPLYICLECADYGCGVVTCTIEREGDFIVWRDFGTENDRSDERIPIDLGYPLVFKFDASVYRRTFSRFG